MPLFFIHTLKTLRTAKPVDIEIHQDFIQILDKIQICRIVVVLFCHRDSIWGKAEGLQVIHPGQFVYT